MPCSAAHLAPSLFSAGAPLLHRGIGIPMAAFLGIKRNLGLRGLWWGLVIVNILQVGRQCRARPLICPP